MWFTHSSAQYGEPLYQFMHLQNKIILDNIQNKNKKKLFISIIFAKYDIIQHIFSPTIPSLN